MPVLDFTLEGRSLMKARNSKGPGTLSCGKPEVTGEVSEQEPSSTTCCVLPDRKSCTNFSKLPLTPYFSSFSRRREWVTLSKALLKSSRMASICSLLSRPLAKLFTVVMS